MVVIAPWCLTALGEVFWIVSTAKARTSDYRWSKRPSTSMSEPVQTSPKLTLVPKICKWSTSPCVSFPGEWQVLNELSVNNRQGITSGCLIWRVSAGFHCVCILAICVWFRNHLCCCCYCRPDPDKMNVIYQEVGLDYDSRVFPSIGPEVLKAVVVRNFVHHIFTRPPLSPTTQPWRLILTFLSGSVQRRPPPNHARKSVSRHSRPVRGASIRV